LRKIEDISNKENFVTDLIVYSEYQAFITGSQFGELIVWKLGGIDEKKQVHQFPGHHKTVTSLMPHPSKKSLFMSASLDCTIKIWCMEVSLCQINI
jgi:WD40 repeat protein